MACCLAAESMPVATAGTSLSHCHRAPKRISCAGLGRKSAACVLLLALAKRDFPVDVNVGRICARLGWIPLDSEEALEARPSLRLMLLWILAPVRSLCSGSCCMQGCCDVRFVRCRSNSHQKRR